MSSTSTYSITDCRQCNVVLIGDSASGKTTFINMIKDPSHVPVDRTTTSGRTTEPKTHVTLIQHGQEFMNVNFIDTPGFNESDSNENRSNEYIQELIGCFVKKDISKVDMILITIPRENLYNKIGVNLLTDCLKMLGRKLYKNTGILVTRSEDKTISDEEKITKDMLEHKNCGPLVEACKLGIFYTGALDKNLLKDTGRHNLFINNQKNRNPKVIATLSKCVPVPLVSDDNKGMFDLNESVLIKCSRVKLSLLTLANGFNHLITVRDTINEWLEDHGVALDFSGNHADPKVDEFAKIRVKKLLSSITVTLQDKQKLSEIRKLVDLQINGVLAASKEMSELHGLYNQKCEIMTKLLDEGAELERLMLVL